MGDCVKIWVVYLYIKSVKIYTNEQKEVKKQKNFKKKVLTFVFQCGIIENVSRKSKLVDGINYIQGQQFKRFTS